MKFSRGNFTHYVVVLYLQRGDRIFSSVYCAVSCWHMTQLFIFGLGTIQSQRDSYQVNIRYSPSEKCEISKNSVVPECWRYAICWVPPSSLLLLLFVEQHNLETNYDTFHHMPAGYHLLLVISIADGDKLLY